LARGRDRCGNRQELLTIRQVLHLAERFDDRAAASLRYALDLGEFETMGADAREPSRLQLAPSDHIPDGVLVDVESPSCLPDREELAFALELSSLLARMLHRPHCSTEIVDYVDL
jgi:hypothetical protein